MRPDDWRKIQNFKKSENWGDPDKMNFALLKRIDALRNEIGRCYVTCGTNGTHRENSQHYLGRAVDLIPIDFNRKIRQGKSHILDLIFAVRRFPFTGIGFYFFWNYRGQKVVGLHVDNRVLKRGEFRNSVWMAVKNDSGEQSYHALDYKNLQKFEILD